MKTSGYDENRRVLHARMQVPGWDYVMWIEGRNGSFRSDEIHDASGIMCGAINDIVVLWVSNDKDWWGRNDPARNKVGQLSGVGWPAHIPLQTTMEVAAPKVDHMAIIREMVSRG